MDAALRLVRACPAAFAATTRLRARRAADRLVPLVVEWVIGEVALVDPPPQVLVGPVGERVVLPQAAALVAFDQLSLRSCRTLLTADTGDPTFGAGQRALQGRDLRDRAAVLRTAPRCPVTARVLHLD